MSYSANTGDGLGPGGRDTAAFIRYGRVVFDYVIVGGGSAGCVLANRLSAKGDRKVLLLEAGGRDDLQEIEIPAAFPKLFNSPVDWDYESTPQEHLGGRSIYMPRGKVVGGSSSINAMIYIRGHRSDYDAWAAAGNVGWGYDEVLPYFKRSEGNATLGGQYHGTEGPLTVSDQRSPNEASRAIVDAARQVGFEHNPDFNGETQEGFGLYQVTQRGGKRCSTARAFLHPVTNRENLEVRTEIHVRRVLLEQGDDGPRAVGVEYLLHGELHTVRAKREVLLCAGAIGSPQLLMVSGIGDGEHLRALGIDVQLDRPAVGRNLHDHPFGPAMYLCKKNCTLDTAESLPRVVPALASFLLMQRGPFTSNIAEAGGFCRTRPDLPAPDMQFHCAPAFFVDHGRANPETGNGLAFGPTLLTPKSRGELRLRRADPGAKPLIDPHHFEHPDDVATMVEGYKIAVRIANAPALRTYRGAPFVPTAELTDDDAIADHMRETAEALYHPVGTCKMGTDDDAVVGPDLCVHGVHGLRVVDASIMPTITRGNTNAPTIMIAEKAADLIG